MIKKIIVLLFCASFLLQISYASPVSTYDLDTLDATIAKVETFGLSDEVTVYGAKLKYNQETFFWYLQGYSDHASESQGDAQAATWNAFTGNLTIPLICDAATQSTCWSLTFYQQGFAGSGVYSLNFSEVVPASPTHPIGDWVGSAVDTSCGGATNNFQLKSSDNGGLTGTAQDTEGENYSVSGALHSTGMSLKANGDDGGDITLECNLNSERTSCSGTWTGTWANYNISCGGTFSLNKQ
ncbi:MAG: hypothetical protein QM479_15100 [Pseudomonadota bacterium]